ncbi:unnamed protein product [Rotaria magnacalcarata]|uniref:Uncharacterized protein n=1 Tax=Rotaria magnacalcarata TaxID=392030 RepID=A0A819TKL2_9BILA|nr:unnamed protein product [Rotaria magnacalcarata]
MVSSKINFQSSMFLDLTTSNFASLRDMNTESLRSITFIQACQLYTNFKVADTCKCTGDCSTNRCQCKQKKTKCCSKCYNGNRESGHSQITESKEEIEHLHVVNWIHVLETIEFLFRGSMEKKNK